MVVTFDFDDTLLRTVSDEDVGIREDGPNGPILMRLVDHIQAGDEVHIVTSRLERLEGTDDWTTVAGFLTTHGLEGLPVHFTDGDPKTETLARLGSKKHFDDDQWEIDTLPDGCEGVLVKADASWSV